MVAHRSHMAETLIICLNCRRLLTWQSMMLSSSQYSWWLPRWESRHSGVCRKCIFVSGWYRWTLPLPCVSIFAPDRKMWTNYLLGCIQNIMDASIPRSVSSCPSAGKSHTEGTSCSRNKRCLKYRQIHATMAATCDAIEIDINVYLQSFRTTCTVQLCN